MLHIESNGCWIAFVGLMVVIAAQLIYYGMDCGNQIIGETIVFLCMGCYIVFECVRNGVWDRKLEPSFKVNVCASLIAAVGAGVMKFVIIYRESDFADGVVNAAASAGIVIGSSTFVLCLILLSIMLLAYKLRKNKLENGLPDEGEDK